MKKKQECENKYVVKYLGKCSDKPLLGRCVTIDGIHYALPKLPSKIFKEKDGTVWALFTTLDGKYSAKEQIKEEILEELNWK